MQKGKLVRPPSSTAAAAARAATAAAIGERPQMHRHTCRAQSPCAQSKAAGGARSRRPSAGPWVDQVDGRVAETVEYWSIWKIPS